MFKLLALATTMIILFGCEVADEQGRLGEMKFVPSGAKLIKNYEGMWMLWELDGNCFLSYNVKGSTGLLTQVKCNENRENPQPAECSQ